MEGDSIKRYVLDTSVVVKWFSEADEGDLEKALKFRADHTTGHCLLIVPDLLLYELANALRYNEKVQPDEVREAVESIGDMDIQIRPYDIHVLSSALTLAFRYQVTVYDAYFLGLAEAIECPLITADRRFYDKVSDSKWTSALSDF